MLKSLVKLHSQRLQLHPRLQTVRRLRSLADDAVNVFFDVDERLFHGAASLGWQTRQSKQGTGRTWLPLKLGLRQLGKIEV